MSPSVTWSSVAPPQRGQQPDGAAPRPSQVAPRRLGELAELVGATLAGLGGPDPEPVVSGVSVSSAQVRPGDLFAALPGASRHGVAFLDQALAAGAVAVLTDPAGAAELAGLDAAPPVLVTPDPRAAVGPLAAEVYGQPSRTLPVFGVTGISGKTTTTFLVRAGLAAAGSRSGLIGNVEVFFCVEYVMSVFITTDT